MTRLARLRGLFDAYAERVAEHLTAGARTYGASVTRFGFAFVFLTFGGQKFLVPGPSPVDEPIVAVAETFRVTAVIPAATVPTLVGVYEALLGFCFLLDRLWLATLLFVPHQLVALLTLAIVPEIAFMPPVPIAYDTFGAFVLKNVVFVGAFLLLLAQRPPSRDQSGA